MIERLTSSQQKLLHVLTHQLSEMFKDVNTNLCGRADLGCTFCCSTSCVKLNAHFRYGRIPPPHNPNFFPYQHLLKHPEAKRQFEELQKQYGWDEKTGFLSEHGCKLPWFEKSDGCMRSSCGAMTNSSIDWGLVNDICNVIQRMKCEAGLIY